jgi:hypothetical protein
MNGRTAGVADEDALRNSKTHPHADFIHSVAEHVNTLPGGPAPTPADEVVGLLEMRYQQHLAQCELQELFENGALQGLES